MLTYVLKRCVVNERASAVVYRVTDDAKNLGAAALAAEPAMRHKGHSL